MPPKLIIFDWDGTLADTTAPITAAMQAAFLEHGLPAPPAESIRKLIGYDLRTIISILHPDIDKTQLTALVRTYTTHYLNPNNQNMRLFEHALPCLNTLKEQGYWLAVATGKGRSGLDSAISQTGTAHFWYATRCASECPSKPAPDMVLEICDELGVLPTEALVVGDTTFDLDMAANARAYAVAVSTGAHTSEQLQTSPHLAILENLGGLPSLLQTL
ncbi:hypothetical protein PL75_10475 [Neisseria arctica]|uniref:HAD family hydrolase n=1 Tax=Neisseria arctica TaxID=1470200 RepID=A0A0J0YPE1_9NEIS|nr:HAD-IA family hydrolase [Neisseria arctica]KLT72007.1 hypothetical protein PL75_10475 [Neisseria arctica]UOO86493.1 HAD-IA family hydrolase [Neisseria arctica]